MKNKILHIGSCDKFLHSFIGFVKENYDFKDHYFLLTDGSGSKYLELSNNVYLSERKISSRFKYYSKAVMAMNKSSKIIIHGLFDPYLVVLLFSMPWLLKKSYWVMWGGDLYSYQLDARNWKWNVRELFRRPVIKRMGHLVTYIKGDVELARKWYGAKGQYHESIMYLSNVYKELDVTAKKDNTLNIQVGNSADPSNNHIEVLEKLLAFKDMDICIYVPLSYGDIHYAKKVIEQGKLWFDYKFIPLMDFMPFDEYLQFLGSIDIAIFNHKRQQAMGNTITLLGLGKTVFIRSDTTQWQLFKDKNIEVLNTLNFELNYINDLEKNIKNTADYFSKETLIEQYKLLFK